MKGIEGGKPNIKLNYLCKKKIYVGVYTNINQLDNVNSRIEMIEKISKIIYIYIETNATHYRTHTHVFKSKKPHHSHKFKHSIHFGQAKILPCAPSYSPHVWISWIQETP